MPLRWQDIPEPRSNVVHLRPSSAVTIAIDEARERSMPRHPSVRSGGRWLSDTQLQLIASTLQHPTPQGVRAAVALLMGDAS